MYYSNYGIESQDSICWSILMLASKAPQGLWFKVRLWEKDSLPGWHLVSMAPWAYHPVPQLTAQSPNLAEAQGPQMRHGKQVWSRQGLSSLPLKSPKSLEGLQRTRCIGAALSAAVKGVVFGHWTQSELKGPAG